MEKPDNPHELLISELQGHWLEINCCKGMVTYPFRLMLRRHDDRPLSAVIRALRCKQCRRLPQSVYLTETANREFCYGAPPGWSIRLL